MTVVEVELRDIGDGMGDSQPGTELYLAFCRFQQSGLFHDLLKIVPVLGSIILYIPVIFLR